MRCIGAIKQMDQVIKKQLHIDVVRIRVVCVCLLKPGGRAEPTTRGGDNARRARIVLPRAIMLRPLRGDITAGTVTQEGVTCARKRDSATRIGVKHRNWACRIIPNRAAPAVGRIALGRGSSHGPSLFVVPLACHGVPGLHRRARSTRRLLAVESGVDPVPGSAGGFGNRSMAGQVRDMHPMRVVNRRSFTDVAGVFASRLPRSSE